MLASTMQFSRYGRSRDTHLRIRGGVSRSYKGMEMPVPSGLNSVLDQTVTAATLPPTRGVLTGFADELTK